MPIIIPDISRWQGRPNWARMWAAGVRAVIIKASQKNYTDPMFLENWATAKKMGFLRSCYHYLDFTDPENVGGLVQARYFLTLFANDQPEIPPAIDFEDFQDPITKVVLPMPANALSHLQDALSEIADVTKRAPILYTGYGPWAAHSDTGDLKGDDPLWTYFPLWVANWGVTAPKLPVPWKDWLFWQYTNKGDGALYGTAPQSLDIDLNQYRGTLDDLKTFAGIAVPPLPHPSTCPTCGQFWPPDVVNNYRVKAGNNLNVYFPTKDSRPSQGLLMAGTPVYIKDYTAMSWYAFFESTPAFPHGGWIYKSYLEKIA